MESKDQDLCRFERSQRVQCPEGQARRRLRPPLDVSSQTGVSFFSFHHACPRKSSVSGKQSFLYFQPTRPVYFMTLLNPFLASSNRSVASALWRSAEHYYRSTYRSSGPTAPQTGSSGPPGIRLNARCSRRRACPRRRSPGAPVGRAQDRLDDLER